MSQLSAELEAEFETEFEGEGEAEGEWEDEAEDEWEDEAFLNALGGAVRSIGGLLGEGEGEDESEWEGELEGEWEDEFEGEGEDEQFLGALGGIARSLGGLLGEGEGEFEAEDEDEAEEFFGRIGRALKRSLPIVRTLAKKFGPYIATAIGGPAAGALARVVASQLEGETEAELEAEFEDMATAPIPGAQAFGEFLAAQAASAESESEAEALVGAAAYVALRPRDRRDLEKMLPALLRGAAVVTRLLHRDGRTRPAVRLVPGIVDAAGRTLQRRLDRGYPVGRVEVGHVLGTTTQRVLSGGSAGRAVMRRHARGLAHAHRHHVHNGHRRHRAHRGYGPRRHIGRRFDATIVSRPVRTSTMRDSHLSRPRPGYIRVVTPVRVPATTHRPSRTVRVVSDVRVPRGATTAGRPVSVAPVRHRYR